MGEGPNTRVWPPMAMLRFVYLALAAGVSGQSATCPNGVSYTGPAVDLLRGTHLRVLELEWAPYAQKDASDPMAGQATTLTFSRRCPTSLVSPSRLGAPMLTGENVYRDADPSVGYSDLWLSWWLRTEERMNASTMLLGHVDRHPC